MFYVKNLPHYVKKLLKIVKNWIFQIINYHIELLRSWTEWYFVNSKQTSESIIIWRI